MKPAKKLYLDDKLKRNLPIRRDQDIPVEVRSTYSNYHPSGTTYELALEKRWRDSMNKKVVEGRERREFIGHIKQWSHSKGRLDEEISRRGESNLSGSQFGKRSFHARTKSLPFNSTVTSKTSWREIEDPNSSYTQKNRDQLSHIDLKLLPLLKEVDLVLPAKIQKEKESLFIEKLKKIKK